MGPALIATSAQRFSRFCPAQRCSRPISRKSASIPPRSAPRSAPSIEAPVLREIQETLDRAQIPPAKQARARDAILRERLSSKRIRGIWLLRLPPGRKFPRAIAPSPHSPAGCWRSPAPMRFNICSGFWHGTSLAPTSCAAEGSRMADSLGAAAADAGSVARADHASARLGGYWRGRALEAAALLRIAAPEIPIASVIKARGNCWDGCWNRKRWKRWR